MKIIYHCYGGAHSSVTAAAIHLGWLPEDRVPEAAELREIPYFDRPVNNDHGNLRYMGKDRNEREIYVVGRRNAARVFENMARGLIGIYEPAERFLFVNVMPYVNWQMVIGGTTSRALGFARIGRPIVSTGVRQAYWQIVNLVQRVKFTPDAGNNSGN